MGVGLGGHRPRSKSSKKAITKDITTTWDMCEAGKHTKFRYLLILALKLGKQPIKKSLKLNFVL
jgi:hypothetical protein